MHTLTQLVGIFGILASLVNQGMALAQAPTVVSTTPSQNESNAPVNTSILVTFDTDINQSTINDSTLVLHARSTGLHQGTIVYDGPTRTAVLDPDEDFAVGEVVTVVLTTGIQSSGGIPLERGYAWSFTTVVDGGTASFTRQAVYSAGDNPVSVWAADLDGDVDLDLATLDWDSDDPGVLVVWLNSGDGSFEPNWVYPLFRELSEVVAADVDNDGDLDLAIGYGLYSGRGVVILLNSGDGVFTVGESCLTGGGTFIVAADFDCDSDLDLATGCTYFSSEPMGTQVLLGNGDGTFAHDSTYYQYPGWYPFSGTAADIDRDGDLDLAVGNWLADSGYVSILRNNGQGEFAFDSAGYYVGARTASIQAADLNADGNIDLATADCGSHSVSVLLNNGDGSFAPRSAYAAGQCPCSIFAADLEGDGDLDLATANSSPVFSVLLNDGDGTFTSHQQYRTGGAVSKIFAADLDGDGDIDLATADYDSSTISIFLNRAPAICGDADGNGIVNISDVVYLISYIFGGGPPPEPLLAGDVDCNEIVNISDAVYLITYIFGGGPEPCAACP